MTLWHGNAHTELAIALSPENNAFVLIVIFIAPLVAASIVWTRFALVGLWMFFLSMLGALLFGAYHHYILVSTDNIGHLPHGSANAHSTFITSRGTRPARIGLGLWRILSGVALGVAW